MKLFPQQTAVVENCLKTDWTTLDLHDATSQVTFRSDEPLSAEERSALEKLFCNRDYAIRAGITIRGAKFPVHQWEKTRGVRLVYGRRGNAVSGCGACVCQAVYDDGSEVYGAITYKFPSLSANAVSKLLNFFRDLGNVVEDNCDPVSGAVGATVGAALESSSRPIS